MSCISVECWQVEHGDILAGFTQPHVVESILTDGIFWYFGNADRIIVVKRRVGSRIQVIRDTPPAADGCPPHGIVRPPRHLEAVR